MLARQIFCSQSKSVFLYCSFLTHVKDGVGSHFYSPQY